MRDIKDLKELLKLDMKTLDAMAPNPTFPLKHLDFILYMAGANFYSEEKIAAVERFLEESSLLNTFFSCRH
ncbi:hypothetical protein PIB30_080912, partial [Stylosanthes scabra]|nr:hypothetical protein [Stylosanthes scabra]